MKKLSLAILMSLSVAGAAMAVDAPKDALKHPGGHNYFKKIDTNGDGVITKEESNAFHDKKFEEMDANKDGKVTEDEAKAAHEKRMEKFREKRAEHVKEEAKTK